MVSSVSLLKMGDIQEAKAQHSGNRELQPLAHLEIPQNNKRHDGTSKVGRDRARRDEPRDAHDNGSIGASTCGWIPRRFQWSAL